HLRIQSLILNLNLTAARRDKSLFFGYHPEMLKDPDKDRDRIIEAYRRGGSWTAVAKLLGISERALLEQRKRHGINKKGQVEH
ncbi:MAG: hypothetical protein HDS82_05350, partial [Bacteroidales bacterium]|nr:hypothetical protein [Bacteroidales bacterium]